MAKRKASVTLTPFETDPGNGMPPSPRVRREFRGSITLVLDNQAGTSMIGNLPSEYAHHHSRDSDVYYNAINPKHTRTTRTERGKPIHAMWHTYLAALIDPRTLNDVERVKQFVLMARALHHTDVHMYDNLTPFFEKFTDDELTWLLRLFVTHYDCKFPPRFMALVYQRWGRHRDWKRTTTDCIHDSGGGVEALHQVLFWSMRSLGKLEVHLENRDREIVQLNARLVRQNDELRRQAMCMDALTRAVNRFSLVATTTGVTPPLSCLGTPRGTATPECMDVTRPHEAISGDDRCIIHIEENQQEGK